VLLTATEAADLADVKLPQLKIWLSSGAFTTPTKAKSNGALMGTVTEYFFTEADVQRLVEFAAKQGKRKRKPSKSNGFVDDGQQTDFTVAQVASMWQLSTDTIQRLFEDEPGVITLGDKNPRGKRRRVTLRIPREVMLRVKKTRSNPR
jgi:hypothetical protein